MKKGSLIFLLVTLILLVGCGGEGYVSVFNDTPTDLLVSVNDNTNELVTAGDTSDTYTVAVMKGVVNNIGVDATGEWVGNYTGTAAVTDGESVVHRISPQVADITLTNLSVDSANCVIENYDTLYFVGEDSTQDKFAVDGNVTVTYAGRYSFDTEEDMSWMPGYTYRFEMEPNACEIQLNNMHSNRVIYYVYLSPSTEGSFDNNDQLGDDVIEPGYGYIWKADGDIGWDVRVEAGDPHADSALYVYDYYDTGVCTSDFTWVYEFPTIFTPVQTAKIAKADAGKFAGMKTNSLNKVYKMDLSPARIEKIKKIDAGKAGLKALRK